MLFSRVRSGNRKLILITLNLEMLIDDGRIFEKSVNCIETLNGASVDVDAARFQWHIGPLYPLQ